MIWVYLEHQVIPGDQSFLWCWEAICQQGKETMASAALPHATFATVSGGGVDFALASTSCFGFPLWTYVLVPLSQHPASFG